MKRSRKILLAVGMLAAVLVTTAILLPLLMRYQAQSRLADYRQELLAAGEKLEISELAPIPSPQGQKNATALWQAVNSLTDVGAFSPNKMTIIKPGRARVAWRQTELNEEVFPPGIHTNVWPLLRTARTNDEDALVEIRSLFAAGNIQVSVDYEAEDLSSSTVAYLTMGKKLAQNASAEVVLDLRDGRTNEAFENLKLSAAGLKFCNDEPVLLSQWTRLSELYLAVVTCWEALQFKGWTDEQLAQLQTQWEAIDFFSSAVSIQGMERAREPMLFGLARASRKDFEGLIGVHGSGLHEMWEHSLLNVHEGSQEFGAFPRYWFWHVLWSYDDERLSLQLYQDMIEILRDSKKRQPVLGRLRKAYIEDNEAVRSGGGISRFPITAYQRSFFVHSAESALRAQTQVEIVTAAIGLERYFLRHHNHPGRLGELVPDYLKQVPVDYMDGKDLRYRLQTDGSFLLYSVGTNGIDDGGDPTPPHDSVPGFTRGRDWVWPSVASAQEVSDYEGDEAKKEAQRLARVQKTEQLYKKHR